MKLPRASGVLLHPTSLPGPFGSGDLGPEARHFVEWLLPLTGIGPGNSPYMSSSAFAGNVLLVDLGELVQHGWLDVDDLAPVPGLDERAVDYAAMVPFRMQRLARAAARFAAQGTAGHRAALQTFADTHAGWLHDYALFMALSEAHEGQDWCDWPPELAARNPAALASARGEHAERIAFWTFCQWAFFRQWGALKDHANARGVEIFGDAPIFVAHHSADVWAHRELFELDAAGRPTVVAGVPPDFFSATGQRWGNPLYRWGDHAKQGYRWWIDRIRHGFQMHDLLRIDHFRGFAGYWETPADEPTVVNGRWMPGPGEALFKAVAKALGPVRLVAEDLGLITPDVDALRQAFAFPGMSVLQFAFAGDASDRYLPHNLKRDTVVYTGTHDNDTTAGWWATATERERHFARGYLATDGHDMPWTLIRAALSSVGDTAIVPMQDVLALPGECRMNFPGHSSGWWRWRFQWSQVHAWHAGRLAELGRMYGRQPPGAPRG
jgi:4-alpha-glucanotransferase